ncbi:hypothetical protein JGI24_01676 [Candidatus Kryptobacter tengchongensis]|uniref:Uncharacterized protein n=1 Tax=Kryptobacter tengchongensis TaxID=1643429 RepID=A0A656DB61_KRYT1|nr:hypothetical protein JGI24_01676 [Candidatus Kryptobacter tengchongensis]
MIFPGSGLKRKRQRLYTILFFSDEDEKPKGVKLSKQALIAYIYNSSISFWDHITQSPL